MAYTTQYGLPQNVVNYLNQQLPTADIYGGITSVPFTFDDVAAEQQIESQASGTLTPEQLRLLYLQQQRGGGEGRDDDNNIDTTNNAGITSLSDAINSIKSNTNIGSILGGILGGPIGAILGAKAYNAFTGGRDGRGDNNFGGTGPAALGANIGEVDANVGFGIQDTGEVTSDAGFGNASGDLSGGRSSSSGESGYGGFCFDPNTPVQMADGSEKKIKDIKLGDDTKGGEVTGVFQFKASDEIHDYKGVTVAGSHYVKENGKFIMVKDSPIAIKIDKIPVVYSLDTSGRRIFIKDIEFADYNGDGIAKGFLTNAGVDLSGFDKEVLRQVENRLI